MAYVNQERKKRLINLAKINCKSFIDRYKIKMTAKVENYSKLVVTIQSGEFDFLKYCDEQDQAKGYKSFYEGNTRNTFTNCDSVNRFFQQLRNALMSENHNNSDMMTDYFDIGYYMEVSIGSWDKPYKLINNDINLLKQA